MRISYIIKFLLRPITNIITAIKFDSLISEKDWLREYGQNKRDRLGVIYHGLILDHYKRRMIEEGGMIGIGANFLTPPILPHRYQGIFISSKASIGANSIIFQQVTIGVARFGKAENKAPRIGDNVFIGAGAKVLGDIMVGNNCRIGANAVVTKDVPDNSIVTGYNRIITKDQPLDNRYFVLRPDGWYYYNNCRLFKD